MAEDATNNTPMEAPASQPEQVGNPRLVAAIGELAERHNDETWRHFYEEVLQANLWLVVAKPVGEVTEGEVPSETGLQAGFVALRDDLGQVSVPAFTDVATLRTWAPPGHPWMVVPSAVLLREVAKNPAAHLDINRRCESQWRVSHEEVVALSRGEIPEIALSPEALAEIILNPETSLQPLPGSWPAQLSSVLRNALVLQRAVVDAYAFEAIAGDSRYAVIGLRFTETPGQGLFTETTDTLRTVAKAVIASDQSLEYVPLNQRELLARVAESVEPFFARR